MILSANKVKDNIIKNTDYLIKSRGESISSFATKSGVTRSTVYKILDGEVKTVQRATVEKIADFFGVSVKLLEENDITSIEETENNPSGNINPISVPIISENLVHDLYQEKISRLIVEFPSTYCYTKENNVICIKLSSGKKPYFLSGELLIVRRFFRGGDNELMVVLNNKNIEIKQKISPNDELVGHIIEERSSEEI